jgi:hypothetical protein
MKTVGRRKFFTKISLSAIGTLLFSIFPMNLFGRSKHNFSSKIKVQLHPNSVKRNK